MLALPRVDQFAWVLGNEARADVGAAARRTDSRLATMADGDQAGGVAGGLVA